MLSKYEKRKKDHIELALKDKNRAKDSGLSQIHFHHCALPEIDFNQVDISAKILGQRRSSPFFVSAMTGGHDQSLSINLRIAKVCEKRGWIMCTGSQRKQFMNPKAKEEWQEIRKQAPNLFLIGNLGLSQLIKTPPEKIEELVQSLGASAMMIHANPLQESLQEEGTPDFKNGKKVLAQIAKNLSVPLCLKETGCGFSYSTLQSLCGLGLKVVDVSGFGGTHWGRIEGDRLDSIQKQRSAAVFSFWGNRTLDSLLAAGKCKNRDFEIWASGGLKNGLDAAKCFALGAQACGFAYVILEKALLGEEELNQQMLLLENELKISLFCTGSKNILQLSDPSKWEMIQ